MGQRRDRMEHFSRSWRPYRRPDDKTGRTTSRRDSLTGDDGTSNMFSHTKMSPRVPGRGDGADLNAVTERDDCGHCSFVSGD